MEKQTEFPFPDDLEGRLDTVLSAVNTEMKTATLLHLSDSFSEGREILTRIRKNVEEGVRLNSRRGFEKYCHDSLLPIGLVAEKSIGPEYKLTPAGKKYGVPIAAFSLKWTFHNNLSLYSVFGSTSSHGKSRSPLNRAKILKILRNKKTLTEADLVSYLDLVPAGVVSHLKNLQKIGFLTYEALPDLPEMKGKLSYYKYTGKVGRPEAVKNMTLLTPKTLEIAKELGTCSYADIAKKTGCKSTNTSAALSGLKKQGFLEKITDFQIGKCFTKAEIKDPGRRFVDEYLEIVEDAVIDGPSLYKLQNEARNFLVSENLKMFLTRGINNYWNVHTRKDPDSRKKIITMIFEYIENKPGARPRDIKDFFKLPSVFHYLTPLLDAELVRKEKHGKQTRYYLRNT